MSLTSKCPESLHSDVKYYRLLSLLSFLSKTHTVSDRDLSQNDLLDPNLSGFKMGHSTETALLCVTEALHSAKADSLSSVLILLDLSFALDTVNHQILLSTLSGLGVSGSAYSWIASYLAGRSYQVTWRGSVSASCTLTCLLRCAPDPLFFSLYTKSLGSVISSHGLSYNCYTDDTQLFLSFPPSNTQVATLISACLADNLYLDVGPPPQAHPREEGSAPPPGKACTLKALHQD